MRPLHYLEIEGFKRFGEKRRIELDHPSALTGPNNCGKSSVLQAIALWSRAIRTWADKKGQAPPSERTPASLNRLDIPTVPVPRTRFFWTNAAVRRGNQSIPLNITLGILHRNRVQPVTMQFRNQGDDLVYCAPDQETLAEPERVAAAARIRVGVLPPMSGLESEEPILQPGRIDVLLGQGQTAQVLRNLCLMARLGAPEGWERVRDLMHRFFRVRLTDPEPTSRGAIDLRYRQEGARRPFDISLAGRGMQQMLLILAWLFAHQGHVLLVDEPDAHLEPLRQRQVYVLLRELAAETGSQVILATHSEVVLEEALGRNLTLLLDGVPDDLARRKRMHAALRLHGTETWIRARQRRHVLYVEGDTDLRILLALARRLAHPAAEFLETRVNPYYIRNIHPERTFESEIQRVEGGFGREPREHFHDGKNLEPALRGLGILDSDGVEREDRDEGDLRTTFWRRYEIENTFVTPELLTRFARNRLGDAVLFGGFHQEIGESLDKAILEHVFRGETRDFETWKSLDRKAARLIWNAQTQRIKLSEFAEDFFRKLAARTRSPMLLRKGDLDRLIELVDPAEIPEEVREKLDRIADLDARSRPEGA